MYAASALAANTICRSAAGSAAPLFTDFMFEAMGVGGAGSLIAGIACLLAPIPFVFYRYGEPIRKRSKFAPTEPASGEDTGKNNGEHHAGSTSGDSADKEEPDKEELALDEEMGVPMPRDLEKQIKEERVAEGITAHNTQERDRYLDASGMEKAER
jgi:DHA1 family multidrug resistance protein-like MFS transporter